MTDRIEEALSGVEGERSVSSYFDAFAPAPAWDELVRWPPDCFALANLVLDHTEAYRFVVAPPSGRSWPPLPDWETEMHAAARAWRDAAGDPDVEVPPLVRRAWDAVTRFRDEPLARIRTGEAWELATALLTLHALADEACAEVSRCGRRGHGRSFEQLAWASLQERGSLARLSPTRVRIVPKTHFSGGGITIRSISRYLALCYESVEVRWRSVQPGSSAERRDYNIVLVPWPLTVEARDFTPASPVLLENMDTDRFGFFEFAPDSSFDYDLFESLLSLAGGGSSGVDAVVFPEAALGADTIDDLEPILAEHGVTFLIAGVREPAAAPAFGRNFLHFGVRTGEGWNRYEQDKHHRWCLDESQVRQYHLTRSLDPKKRWWEATDIQERTLHVIDVGGGITTAPLICEDLARLDEVADLVRRIGPSLVVAVLLDGPQLRSRWPARYSSVIADDPGSAVLTLTAFGMAARSRPPGRSASRVVAHWNSRTDGVHEIELAPRAAAILLSAAVEPTTLWTADGRSHRDVPRLGLSGIRQLHTRSGRGTKGRSTRTLARSS